MTRVLIVGASSQQVCGVRDHARELASALDAHGAEADLLWWDRHPDLSWRDTRRAALAWASAAAARAQDADAVVWEYSVFTYGRRGVATLVPPLARRLASAGKPLVGFLHEPAFQWGDRGLRGRVQAASHRVALRALMKRLAIAIVTSEDRAEWLRRPWLPRRPVEFVPLFSNVPVTATANGRPPGLRIGVFGYRMAHDAADIVTEAVALLLERRPDTQLVLVGAPGPGTEPAARWREAASRAGLGRELELTGVLAPAELSQQLVSLDAVVFPDPAGPTPRRGTLAAVLAHGCPVVAFRGPQEWRAFGEEEALRLAVAKPAALAAHLEVLALDEEERRAQGARASAFYRRRLAPEVAADRLIRLVERVA